MQERASTLRHLMSEMQILSLSWENLAEEVKPTETIEVKGKGKKGKKGEVNTSAVKETNLLDEVEDLLDMPGLHHHNLMSLLLLLLQCQLHDFVSEFKDVQSTLLFN